MAHVLRLAEAMDATVVFVGNSPTPGLEPDLDRYFKRWRSVRSEICNDAQELFRLLHQEQARPIVLEISDRSRPYFHFNPAPGETIALIVGPESVGLPDDVLALASEHLYVPMAGQSSCLSAGMALAVAAYHFGHVARAAGIPD